MTQEWISALCNDSLEEYCEPLTDLGFNSIESVTGFTPEKFESIIKEKIVNNNEFENEYHFVPDSKVFAVIELQKKLYHDRYQFRVSGVTGMSN